MSKLIGRVRRLENERVPRQSGAEVEADAEEVIARLTAMAARISQSQRQAIAEEVSPAQRRASLSRFLSLTKRR